MNREILNAQNVYNTGHEAFDGILNYYAEKYANKSLILEVSVSIPENLEIDIFDVNIVLGNLLDNALENAIINTEVDFSLKYNAGMLHISMSNLFEGNIKRVDGNIVSRKGDNHGLGLDNVKRIVDKYYGTMVMECDDGRFDVDVIMFVG
ncbi:MAG: ATP-binding protein [Eubacteriales bacterium]|nr:ATP-binding protein [Eubacteriales bacterium]